MTTSTFQFPVMKTNVDGHRYWSRRVDLNTFAILDSRKIRETLPRGSKLILDGAGEHFTATEVAEYIKALQAGNEDAEAFVVFERLEHA